MPPPPGPLNPEEWLLFESAFGNNYSSVQQLPLINSYREESQDSKRTVRSINVHIDMAPGFENKDSSYNDKDLAVKASKQIYLPNEKDHDNMRAS